MNSVDPALSLEIHFVVPHSTRFNATGNLAHLATHQRAAVSGGVDRISSVVPRGVSHEGRLIDREACDQEQEGNRDTRVRQV